MEEFRPRVVPVAGAAGAHADARHRLWRIDPRGDPAGASAVRASDVATVGSAVDFLRRTVRDPPSIGADAGPVRVAECWRTADGTSRYVAGRTAADAERLGERLRDVYGADAVTAVDPTDGFPPVRATDHVACALFRLRRHRLHPLATAPDGPTDPYRLLATGDGAAGERSLAVDGGSEVRTVVQAAFRPRSDAWDECDFVASDWRDLLMRVRGVDDASAFARRIARRAEGPSDDPENPLARRIAARGEERGYDVTLRAAWFGERPAAVAREASAVGTAFAAAFRGPTGQALVPRSPADPREMLRDAVSRWWGRGAFVLPLTELAAVAPLPRARYPPDR